MFNGYGTPKTIFTELAKIPIFTSTKRGTWLCWLYGWLIFERRYLKVIPWKYYGYDLDIQSLGFSIHPEKSIIIPRQTVVCLGLSYPLPTRLRPWLIKGEQRLRKSQKSVFSCNRVTNRKIANLIRNLVANFPAVTFGQLRYRHLKKVKTTWFKYL